MDFIDESLLQYAELHSSPESELLQKLHRETLSKVIMPRMISGHLQGRALAMFSRMVRPVRILEIGTYTGYSALCLAEGLLENGKLITIDINDELEEMACRYFAESPFGKKIEFLHGDALQLVPKLNETFDLVFLDADKEHYPHYLPMIIDKLNPGGFIIADNVLWSGKVLNDHQEMDVETLAIDEFNRMVRKDARLEKVLLPVRDGLMIIQKTGQ